MTFFEKTINHGFDFIVMIVLGPILLILFLMGITFTIILHIVHWAIDHYQKNKGKK